MPIQIACPSCGRALRVPDALLGKAVRSPNCPATVDAAPPPPRTHAIREPAAAPIQRRDDFSQPVDPELASRPRPRLDGDYDDDDYDEGDDEFEYRRRRRRRSYRSAHRGPMI